MSADTNPVEVLLLDCILLSVKGWVGSKRYTRKGSSGGGVRMKDQEPNQSTIISFVCARVCVCVNEMPRTSISLTTKPEDGPRQKEEKGWPRRSEILTRDEAQLPRVDCDSTCTCVGESMPIPDRIMLA